MEYIGLLSVFFLFIAMFGGVSMAIVDGGDTDWLLRYKNDAKEVFA